MNISRLALLTIVWSLVTPGLSTAQSVTAAEREALVQLRTGQGGRAEEVDALIRVADAAAAKGLPTMPLTNKIREGLAKGAAPTLIDTVVRQMAADLDASDRLLREFAAAAAPLARPSSVTLLAEALGSGVTADEVRELRARVAAPAGPSGQSAPIAMTDETIANAARGLSLIKEAKLSVPDGTAVMAEAARKGFRAQEMPDLGREIKRREADFRAGRANLRSVRDAIARGDRLDQVVRSLPPAAPERPATAQPATPPARPNRPETPARPEPPVRPERPAAAGRDR